jgi:acyl-[acyl-carrier-protein]-phospholipid O-acyltransferase/long-chain-fatty-acid--[acyl-carrier-protein] ligase
VLPRGFHIEGEMSARARRAIAGRRLYDEMSGMILPPRTPTPRCCRAGEARAIHGGKAKVLEDVKRVPLSYDRLLVGTLLGKRLARRPRRARSGVLLPNINGAVVGFSPSGPWPRARC